MTLPDGIINPVSKVLCHAGGVEACRNVRAGTPSPSLARYTLMPSWGLAFRLNA